MNEQSNAPRSEQPRRSWYFEHPKRLYWGTLAATDFALYTAPAAPTSGPPGKVRIDTIWIANTDTVARTVTLEIRTGASSVFTQFLPAVSVPANSITQINNCNTILESSETISGLGSINGKINLRISGTELLTLPTA